MTKKNSIYLNRSATAQEQEISSIWLCAVLYHYIEHIDDRFRRYLHYMINTDFCCMIRSRTLFSFHRSAFVFVLIWNCFMRGQIPVVRSVTSGLTHSSTCPVSHYCTLYTANTWCQETVAFPVRQASGWLSTREPLGGASGRPSDCPWAPSLSGNAPDSRPQCLVS